MEELYFCIKLTEEEHNQREKILKEECERIGAKLTYWRKLIDGHVPLFREVRLTGTQHQMLEINKFINGKLWYKNMMKNPWK